jgi:hypothetical protein
MLLYQGKQTFGLKTQSIPSQVTCRRKDLKVHHSPQRSLSKISRHRMAGLHTVRPWTSLRAWVPMKTLFYCNKLKWNRARQWGIIHYVQIKQNWSDLPPNQVKLLGSVLFHFENYNFRIHFTTPNSLWAIWQSQANQCTRSVLNGQQRHTTLWDSPNEPHIGSQGGSTPMVTCTKHNFVLHCKLPCCGKIHHACWWTVRDNSARAKHVNKYAANSEFQKNKMPWLAG